MPGKHAVTIIRRDYAHVHRSGSPFFCVLLYHLCPSVSKRIRRKANQAVVFAGKYLSIVFWLGGGVMSETTAIRMAEPIVMGITGR